MSDDVSYSGAYSGSGEHPSGGHEPAGEASERPRRDPERTFLGELVHRRVPQVLAGYLGITWTLFELSQWLTEQYLVSPYLGRILLLGLLLLPSVLIVTYRHGRPGPDQWTDSELWVVSGNIAAAVFALLIVFGGVELGSMVRTVQVSAADTTGGDTTENIVRQVPKKQFRKRVALFYFDEAEGPEPTQPCSVPLLPRSVPTLSKTRSSVSFPRCASTKNCDDAGTTMVWPFHWA